MENNNCIKNLLKFILLLQNNSSDKINDCFGCDKPFLGPTINKVCYNTRVITLYSKDGTIFTVPYGDSISESSYFRIKQINDNCCTLLILRKENDEFYSTGQTIVINVNCICAVKCIKDTYINCL